MTEFEAATLAVQQGTLSVQQATLSVQQASLELQQGQLWAAIAIPVVAAVVGLLQVGVVVYGIRAMIRANEGRAEADRQRARQEDARHAEAMTALRALVQGLDQQGETLRAVVQSLDRQGAALEAALKGRA